jgi:hypothetical protein
MKANRKTPVLHSEGDTPEHISTAPDPPRRYLLPRTGRNGHGQRIAPVWSACAIMVSSQNLTRMALRAAADDLRRGSRGCSLTGRAARCARKRSAARTVTFRGGNNNARMASVLLQGTARELHRHYAYVGEG